MTTTRLADGTRVHCLRRSEAHVLDHHVRGYLNHGVSLKPDQIIFDVGANIGLFGVRACQTDPTIQVYAFEPVPSISAVCRRNAEAHGAGRFHVLECGLSSAPGEAQFVYYPNTPAASTARPDQWSDETWRTAVAGQVQSLPPEMWWAKLVPGPFIGIVAWYLRRGAQHLSCELRTLSQVIRDRDVARIDLLKVDCEGFELDVLQGLDEEHWALVGQAVIEVHDADGRADEVCALLTSWGLTDITREKESGFEGTAMINVYASRPTTEAPHVD